MITHNLNNIVFLDIETVRYHKTLEDLKLSNEHLYNIWVSKLDYIHRTYKGSEDMGPEEAYENFAGILPEFGRIACVTFGMYLKSEKKYIKTVHNRDEMALLTELKKTIDDIMSANNSRVFCAHNGKVFDLPYMAKRFIINGIMPPVSFPRYDTKPWEMKVLDTKDVWSGNVFKALSSLDLICATLGIETPKGDIDGSQVSYVFHEEDDLERIVKYCEKDVEALMEIVKFFKDLKQ